MEEKTFKRGDVFNAYVPKLKESPRSPLPSYILEGSHNFVVLSDSNDPTLPRKSVMVAPITSLNTAVNRNNVKPSYVPLEKNTHPFLDHDSYISTHQSFPISRNWLGEVPVGKIEPEKMSEVDLQMLRTLGLENTVSKIVHTALNKQMESFERAMGEAAPSREKGMER